MKTPYYRYIDAIPNIQEADREWYKTFILAYYYRSTPAMNKLGMSVKMRRELYNNHRAVCDDAMNQDDLYYIKEKDNTDGRSITSE